MHLLFYRSGNPGAFLIRLFTRRREQLWAEVPSHVAIEIGGAIWEAHAPKGVTSRAYNSLSETMDAQVPVPVSEESAATAKRWLEAQVGRPYDYWAICLDTVFQFLPAKWRVGDTTKRAWDCSRLAAAALRSAGVDVGAGRMPISPNDLWLRFKAGAILGTGETEKDGK